MTISAELRALLPVLAMDVYDHGCGDYIADFWDRACG